MLAFDLTGTGPGFLCLPGLGATKESFAAVATACGDLRTVICPDYRGIGASLDHAEDQEQFAWDDCAADVWELLDHLATAHPALFPIDVVGMSFGGVLAQLLAYQRPASINQLFLVSTSHEKSPYGLRINRMLQVLIQRTPPEEFGELTTTFTFSQTFHDAHPGLRALRQEGTVMPVDATTGLPVPGGAGFEGRWRPAFVRMAELGAGVPELFSEPFPLPPAQVVAIVGAADLMVSELARGAVCALSADPIRLPTAGHVILELPRLIRERLDRAT